MREIKFRAWDNEKNEIFKPTYDASNGNLFDLHLSMGGQYTTRTLEYPCSLMEWHNNRFTIMQYTGLKDKNGKEIYEGDIVNVNRREPSFKAIVHWRGSGFWLYEHQSNVDEGVFDGVIAKETLWSGTMIEDSELLGNIYENPELL